MAMRSCLLGQCGLPMICILLAMAPVVQSTITPAVSNGAARPKFRGLLGASVVEAHAPLKDTHQRGIVAAFQSNVHKASYTLAKKGRRASKLMLISQHSQRHSIQKGRHASKLTLMSQRSQRIANEQTHKSTSGMCDRFKLRWWIKMKYRCVKAYGPGSRWNRKALDGECLNAWRSCNSGFYAVCCTQDKGPVTMRAYCDKQDFDAKHGKRNKTDKACKVEGIVRKVTEDLTNIKDAVKLMEANNTNVPPVTAAPTLHTAAGPAAAPSSPPASPAAPDGILAAAPAPAPVDGVLTPTATASPNGTNATTGTETMKSKCDRLKLLTQGVASKIQALRAWAERDGIKQPHDGHTSDGDDKIDVVAGVDKAVHAPKEKLDSPEAKDPDLTNAVKGMLKVGHKLDRMIKQDSFCTSPLDDPLDDAEADAEDDLQKDPTADWEDDDEDDEEDEKLEPNITALIDLLEWDVDMGTAVEGFETQVHPSGYKWWRYRYEYTMLESFVFAVSIMFLYFLQWLFGGFVFRRFKFYKTGRPSCLHKYPYVYFVFKAASVCVMVFTAYALYVPWGKNNIFDVLARVMHDVVNDAFRVPYLGYSWLFMVLDIQFQLFGTFCLYTLFIYMVTRNYTAALQDWKELSEGRTAKKRRNEDLYRRLELIVKNRVSNTESYRQSFIEHQLKLKGVDGLERALSDSRWHDFKLHLYLTDSLGKSVEHLVEVSLVAYACWGLCALFAALLAHMFEVAFMFFLPFFLVVGAIMLVSGYLYSLHIINSCEDLKYKEESRFVTIHSYCRALQVIMYCTLYSFVRLLLSNDIFSHYPGVYFAALFTLACLLVLLGAFGGEAIKEAACALNLIPHISEEEFKKRLEKIAEWHTCIHCHDTGVKQLPATMAFSTEWAGAHAHNTAADEGSDSARSGWRTFR